MMKWWKEEEGNKSNETKDIIKALWTKFQVTGNSYTHMKLYICIYTHIDVVVDTDRYVYACMYVHICVYMCMYMCEFE